MEATILMKELMISLPTIAIYIAGMRLGLFPRFQSVAVDIAIVLLQLLAIRELLRMYLALYLTFCLFLT
jgi:hypothetical protein